MARLRGEEIEKEASREDIVEEPDKTKPGGYDPVDILKAPAKPPKPDASETAEDTSNKKVIIIFAAAIMAALLGLVFMFMNTYFLVSRYLF